MIATVSAQFQNCEHTLNTLRYAQRLKRIATANQASKGQKKAKEPEDDVDIFLKKQKRQEKVQSKPVVRSRISDMSTVKVSRATGKRFDAGLARRHAWTLKCTVLCADAIFAVLY